EHMRTGTPVQGVVGVSTGASTAGGSTSSSVSSLVAPAGKVVFPLSRLSKMLPRSVVVLKKDGFDEREIEREDTIVPPGEYTLVFRKPGFDALRQTFNVTADGVSPPIERLKFEFIPKAEIKELVDQAKRAIEDKRYKQAIADLQGIVEKAPDYQEAV